MSAHGVPFLLLFGASSHDAGDLSADLSSSEYAQAPWLASSCTLG